MSRAGTNPGNATSPIGNRLAGAAGGFFRFGERGASPRVALAPGFAGCSILKLVRNEGRWAHVLVHVIAVSIVFGYAALKIVSYLDSKGAGTQ